jgi:heptosyltransferase-2
MRFDPGGADETPILLIPYMWIGDFVRCHSAVRVLRGRFPNRPLDMLTSTLCAPLIDYMPGVRQGIVFDLPRGRLPVGRYLELARRLRANRYGTALVMLRTWKSALAPFLAGIPERAGFVGEGRFGLINDLRWGERQLERMIDRCGALALPKGASLPPEWPFPELVVPPAELDAWRQQQGLIPDGRPVAVLGPGAVGAGKAWPPERFSDLAGRLTAQGVVVWVVGGPADSPLTSAIAAAAGPLARSFADPDLRHAILAVRAADVAITNDSGLTHISAALGTPTVAIFGPTSPRLWAPLNPLAATLEPPADIPCPTCGRANCPEVRHRRTADVSVERVWEAVQSALERRQAPMTAR